MKRWEKWAFWALAFLLLGGLWPPAAAIGLWLLVVAMFSGLLSWLREAVAILRGRA